MNAPTDQALQAIVAQAVRRRWRLWLGYWLLIVALSAGVSLLLPKWYRGVVTLLPPSDDDNLSLSFSALLRGGNLAAGRLPHTTSPEDLLAAIAESRTLAHLAIHEFRLVDVYHVKNEDDAIESFHKHLSVGTTREGILYVAVEDRSPERAAALANYMVDQLDHFNRETRMTAGKSARVFIEGRLDETRARLKADEDSLKQYLAHHPPTVPVSQGAAVGAEALAQRIALQVKVETLEQSQAPGSEEVRRARGELEAMDRELRRIPESGTELDRLAREVKVQDQVFALLTAQLEEARVREHKDTPTLQALDRAEVPHHKHRPRRSLIVATATVLGLFASTLWAVYVDRRSQPVGGAR